MTENQTKKCQFCGEEILAVAIKCKHCGSDLTQSPVQQPTMTPPNQTEAAKKKKPGCLKVGLGVVVLAIGVIALIAGLFSGGSGDIMPIDERTLDKFKEANSKAAMKLYDKRDEMTSTVMASVAFRMAVTDLGYDPDKTILYWMSDEFKTKMKEGTQEEALMQAMGAGSLITLAFGDGSSDEEFTKLISNWSPEVQAAAKKRRGSK